MKRNSSILIMTFVLLSSCELSRSKNWEIFAEDEYDKDNLAESIEYINKAIGITPNRSILYLKRALYYKSMLQLDSALSSINRSINLNDTVITAYSIKAGIFEELNQIDSSLFYHSIAIGMDPENSRVYSSRGRTYFYLDRFDKAMLDLNKALSLDSLNLGALYDRGCILCEYENNSENAINDFTRFIENYEVEGNIDRLFLGAAYGMRGNCYEQMGDFVKACEDWNTCLGLGVDEIEFKIESNCEE